MTKYITWTEAEWELVALRFNSSFIDKESSMTKRIKGAQETLPKERQRNVTNQQTFQTKVTEIANKLALVSQPATTFKAGLFNFGSTFHKPYVQSKFDMKDLPELIEKLSPSVGISDTVESAIEVAVQFEIAKYAELYRSTVTQRIQQLVAERIATIQTMPEFDIGLMVEKEFGAQVEETKKNYGVYVDKVVSRKRAVIVGLLGSQAAQVQQLVGDSLSLTFLQSDAAIHQIRKSSQSADYVLMMRKFISHKCTNAVNKNNHSGFFLIDGGMTELEEKLISLV